MEDKSSAHSSEPLMANHLCVLVHGLWGNPSHLTSVKEGIRARYSEEQLHILVAESNSNNYTYDGVQVGGERVAQEIEDELAKLEARGQIITRLSVVGYSLGGLISRYAMGLLLSRGWLDRLEPVNFTAFASPFLGVRSPHEGLPGRVWNSVGPRMLSESGRQLFLVDSFRDTGRPLLAVMCDPASIFAEALRRFRHRALYANAVNDRSAPWLTSGVARTDPFADMDAVDLRYMEGRGGVLLDPDEPALRRAPHPKDRDSLYARAVTGGNRLLDNLPMYALMSVVMPFALTFLTVNAGIQAVRSSQRVVLHNSSIGGAFASARIPYLLDGALETLAGDGAPAAAAAAADDPASPASSVTVSSGVSDDAPKKPSRSRSRADFPLLKLDPRQSQMIDDLDSIGWNKYPVYIKKVKHSHAAIIVRRRNKNFDEGWTVINHWLDKEFEI